MVIKKPSLPAIWGGYILIIAFLFFSIYTKEKMLLLNIWQKQETLQKQKRDDFLKTFIVPPVHIVQIISLDRYLFASRILDTINILNRPYLWWSNRWFSLSESALFLNPKSLNTLVITAYQYMAGRKSPMDNFYKVDTLIKKHINVAKNDWRLMMLMSVWWQFKVKDKSLNQSLFYAKYMFNNPKTPRIAKEMYPILLSKLGEKQKALTLYYILYKTARTETEKNIILNQIRRIKGEF